MKAIYFMAAIEWITDDRNGFLVYDVAQYEQDHPYLPARENMTQDEIRAFILCHIGLSRWDAIVWNDEYFADLRDRDLIAGGEDNEEGMLSDAEKMAMIRAEYAERGLLAFLDEDVVIHWAKEISEAEYAQFKEITRAPVGVPDSRGVWPHTYRHGA